MQKISIAKDYSMFPIGRKTADGPYSGERFLDEFLYPKLRDAIDSGGVLEVDLGDTLGLTAAFLDEAFGGLIREKGLDLETIRKHLRVVTSDPNYDGYIEITEEYMQEASEQTVSD